MCLLVTMSDYDDSSGTEEVESDSSVSNSMSDYDDSSDTEEVDMTDDEYMSGDGGDDNGASRSEISSDGYCLFVEEWSGYEFVGLVKPTKTAIKALLEKRRGGITQNLRVGSLVSLDPNATMPRYEWTATADNNEQFTTGVIIPKSRVVTDVAERVVMGTDIDNWYEDATMAVTDPMAYIDPRLRDPLTNLLKTSRIANKLFTPNYCLFLDAEPSRDTYQYILKGFAWTNIQGIEDSIKSHISSDIQRVQLTGDDDGQSYTIGADTLKWKAWIGTNVKRPPDYVGWLILKETAVRTAATGVARGNNNVFRDYPWLTTAVHHMPNPIAYVPNQNRESIRFIAETNHKVGEMFQLRGSGEDTAQSFSDNLLNS